MEDARGEDVAPDHAEVGRRVFGLGFFDDGVHPRHALGHGGGVDNAVGRGFRRRNLLHAEHRALVILVLIDHLLHHRRTAVDQVVGEDDGEGFVADHRLRAQHGMAEPQRFGLADVDEVDAGRADRLHQFQIAILAARGQFGFQFVGLVEVVLDGALGAAADEDDVGDAGLHRLFDRILDQRLVDDGQHFLGAGLGGRQKTGAQTGNRKYGFFYFLHISSLIVQLQKP